MREQSCLRPLVLNNHQQGFVGVAEHTVLPYIYTTLREIKTQVHKITIFSSHISKSVLFLIFFTFCLITENSNLKVEKVKLKCENLKRDLKVETPKPQYFRIGGLTALQFNLC